MIYFTADLHLGSTEIIAKEYRPFKSPKDFALRFVQNVNNLLSEKDILYIVGDYIQYNYDYAESKDWEYYVDLVRCLNCYAVLVIGNHECNLIKRVYNGDALAMKRDFIEYGFTDVCDEVDLQYEDRHYYVNHFPNLYKAKRINIYAHTHAFGGITGAYGINVGCMLYDYKPIPITYVNKLYDYSLQNRDRLEIDFIQWRDFFNRKQ